MAPHLSQFGLGQSLAESWTAKLFSSSCMSIDNAVPSCHSRSDLGANVDRCMGSISPFHPQPLGLHPSLGNHPAIVVPNFKPIPCDQFAAIRNNTLAATYKQNAFTCDNGASISAHDLRHLLLARSQSPALFSLVAKMYNAHGCPDRSSLMQKTTSLNHLHYRNNLTVGSKPAPSGFRFVDRQMVQGGNPPLAGPVHRSNTLPGQARRAPKCRSLPHPKHGPYTCPLCRKEFSTPPHFASHIGNYHDNSQTKEPVPNREPKRRRVDLNVDANNVEPNEDGINLNLELSLNCFSTGESSSGRKATPVVTVIDIS